MTTDPGILIVGLDPEFDNRIRDEIDNLSRDVPLVVGVPLVVAETMVSRLSAAFAAALEALEPEPVYFPNWILWNQPPKSPRRWQ